MEPNFKLLLEGWYLQQSCSVGQRDNKYAKILSEGPVTTPSRGIKHKKFGTDEPNFTFFIDKSPNDNMPGEGWSAHPNLFKICLRFIGFLLKNDAFSSNSVSFSLLLIEMLYRFKTFCDTKIKN
jgi:hypothetical protein